MISLSNVLRFESRLDDTFSMAKSETTCLSAAFIIMSSHTEEVAKLLASLFQEPYSVPLGRAAQKGYTETVQRLLEAGATVNYQNKVMTNTVLCAYTVQLQYDCSSPLLRDFLKYNKFYSLKEVSLHRKLVQHTNESDPIYIFSQIF